MASSFYPANVPLINYFFYNYTLTANGPNLPLAGGFIFFRDDNDHDVDKNTYSDVSDPNDPVVNPNPLPLNAVGAWPFFYAEEGLYYIVITGPDGDFDNPIWTLEHINFAGDAGAASENVVNYIPNGQFLLHNDLPAEGNFAAGQIREDITPIAYGGWTFERSPGSTAVDIVTFERYDEYTANPTGNPRYAVRVQCTEADSGDAVKDVRVKFNNVNRFASDTQQYTFAFSGMDNDALSVPVDLYLIKNFGTGGSTQTETLITTFNLTPSESDFYFAFTFGDNTGKVIGPDNDDYVQLALRLPTDSEFDVLLITDGQLQSGNLAGPTYPETTQTQDVSAALGGGFPVPDPLGFDLYLLPRLTKTGWTYDHTEIGKYDFDSQLIDFDPTTGLHADTNLILAAGYKFVTANYSPLGIPFQRLFDKYFDDTTGINVPVYGTGLDYMTCGFSGSGSQLIISNNTLGSVSNAANGSPSPGFTIGVVHQGDAGYDCQSYLVAASTFYIENTNAGVVTAIDAGTSGFTVATIQIGTTVLPQISSVATIAASGITGGDYYSFYTYDGGANQYYNWFTVDGAGMDPAPGGTGILTVLLSTDDAATVAQKIRTSLNGFEVTSIQTVAASTIPAGSYFTISATGGGYFVWYEKDGTGTQPSPGGTGIKVAIVTADTATQVAQKTQVAMNSYSFAVPDPRGNFLRIANGGTTIDPGPRWSMVPGIIGTDKIGTFELSQNLEITVENNTNYLRDVQPAGSEQTAGGNVYTFNGQVILQTLMGSESRPINLNVTAAIRY